MKQLIWKEWRESWSLAVFAVLMFGFMMISGAFLSAISVGASWLSSLPFVVAHFGPDPTGGQMSDLPSYMFGFAYQVGQALMCWGWLMTSLSLGGRLVSTEVLSGTLQLLNALPISRNAIWWTKVGAGLSMIVFVIFVSLGILEVVAHIFPNLQSVTKADHTYRMTGHYGSPNDPNGIGLIAYFPQLVNSLAKSSIANRTIGCVALTLSVYSVCALAGSFSGKSIQKLLLYQLVPIAWVVGLCWLLLASGFTFDHAVIPIIVDLITVPLFLGMSYQVFVHGETLQTEKRFQVLAQSMKWVLPTLAAEGAVIFAVHQIFRIGVQ